ncbi:MAG: type Z 30S ribosomal protein S14 [Candidatus Parcubacteria bacterium]|nr:type Z 30S ribosomal protein S14 [Candidatus Paceibacterota bacterium]
MARKAMIVKALKEPKFKTRTVRRCKVCGRNRGYLRYFDMCRICVRELAMKGELNGFFKSSK